MKPLSAKSISLVRNSTLLVTSLAIQRLSAFALLGLVVHHSSKDTLSLYSLFLSVLAFAGMIFPVGLQTTPTRLMFDYPLGFQRDQFVRTVHRGLLILIALFSSLLFVVTCFAPLPIGLTTPADDLLLIAGTAFFASTFEFYRSYMRAKDSFVLYSISSCLRHGGALIYVFGAMAAGFPLSLPRIIQGYFFSTFLCFFCGLLFVQKTISREAAYNGKILKTSILFSIPLAVHTLFGWLIEHSGRWIGASIMGLEKIALYMVLVQIIATIGAIPRTFFEVRVPQIGKALEKSNYSRARQIILSTSGFNLLAVLTVYLLGLLVLKLFPQALPPQYQLQTSHLILAFFANLIDVIYLAGYQRLLMDKKTTSIAFAMITAGTYSLGATFFAATLFGTSLALLSAYASSLVILALLSHFPISIRPNGFKPPHNA